jgi:AcrR family transcriptional regulator
VTNLTLGTRRERLRLAASTEIKQVARRLLTEGGPGAITLRAIAREMGMTAPAIYRYFPSLDVLVIELTGDLYDEVRETVEAARERVPADQPLHRLFDMARAFRSWSLAHPAEFGLMFGAPLPGMTTYDEACRDLESAGARFGEAFLTVFAELWRQRPFATPVPVPTDATFATQFAPYLEIHGDRYPAPLVITFLDGWMRLYGMVAMEVFGHLGWAVTDMQPLFEAGLAAYAQQLTAAPD